MKASKAWLLAQYRRAAEICEGNGEATNPDDAAPPGLADYPPCRKLAALARRQLGDHDRACRHLRAYLADDPYDADQMRSIAEELDCGGNIGNIGSRDAGTPPRGPAR